jgi:hypothetical protein
LKEREREKKEKTLKNLRRVKYVSEDKHTQKKRFQSYKSVLNGSQRAHIKL